MSACDIPTELPEFENRWIVPAEDTRFGVAELLPGDVSLAADSSAFIVDFDPVAFSETLGSVCAACVPFDGTTVPKPAFIGGFSSTLSFPPEVTAVDVVGGTVQLELTNGFNFDPIRPASGVFGTMELRFTDEADGDLLGSVVIDGADQSFAPGSTLVRSVDLGSASVEGGIETTVLLDSPTGDPVTIDVSDVVGVTATPSNIRVGSVAIDVANQSVTFDPVSLDLEDLDTELIDRVESGAFVLDVVNPFAVGADFDLEISGPTIATIQKSASITSDPESRVVIDFSGVEIRNFLGEPGVVLSGGAIVDAGAGNIVVQPGQELVLSAALDLVIRIGGES
ncbi:MAG: hypothetical protein R3253_04470 [Longimicrobiales bacterium]|nr:hypothetical protein [Longimicrobiales bacterium]